MPPAAFLTNRSLLPYSAILSAVFSTVLLSGLGIAHSAPSVLVDDGFDRSHDSLWHFQAAAFTEGVLSPGLEADTKGRTPAGGQLRIDPPASALRFAPRQGVKAHRSCFLGYRSDFRIEDVFARKVEVDVLGEVINPAGKDSLGGLYILVRYEDEYGNAHLARTTADIRFPQTVSLDTASLVPVRKTDWFSSPPLEAGKLAQVRSRVIGLGLCYISESGAAKAPALLVGGFKARGELRWPPLPGSPEDSEIMAGDTVALAWKFPRALDAEFQWYRNEKPIPSVRGPRFVFRPGPDEARLHVFRADALLRNGDRIATGQMRVKVLRPAPPILSRQSGDTSVPEGGTAFFRITASGLQPLAYQWHKNGKPIAGATGTTYSFAPTAVSEGGRYHCEVKDKQGRSAGSRPVLLIVKPGPEKEAGMPMGLTVGPKLGLNISDFYRDRASGASPTSSQYKLNLLQAGLGAAWQVSPVWSLQADLLFSRKGVEYDFEDHISTFALDYLELPLLVRARLGRWMPKSPIFLLAGGYGALLVSATREEDWGAWKGSESLEGFETFDYGVVVGMSWQFGIISAEWRYDLGLASLEPGGTGDPRMNGAFSAMLGLTLFTAQDGPR